MKEEFDVAIVGAGPAGISAACILADAGVKTVVIERGEFPGAKNMSGGVLYGHDLAEILPDYAEKSFPIERNIIESRMWYLSKDSGFSLGFRDAIFAGERKHNVFTVGRAKFDRWFAEQAKRKGALIIPSTVVVDLRRNGKGQISGVVTNREDGEISAKVTILADGINSPLAARTGFRREPRPEQVALAVKEVIELPGEIIDQRFGVANGNGVTTEILGEITGGMAGIAILYTNRNTLSVSVGGNLADFARLKIKPYELIETYKQHPMIEPLIRDGKPIEYIAHWLAEGGYDAIPRLYGDGYVIAGDSAMLFNMPHREGNNLAMLSGKMAAEAVIDALKRDNYSGSGLAGYSERMAESQVIKDMKKYRRFGEFLYAHKELFNEIPRLAAFSGRELITVNGVSKKQKQSSIIRKWRQFSVLRLMRLFWSAWRAINGG